MLSAPRAGWRRKHQLGAPAGGISMIDWSRVDALRDEIGVEDFAEVVALFLDEADEAVARLSPDRGAAAVSADLHFLKGSALNLGFDRFAALCQDGERRAAQGDLSVDLSAVRSCYNESKLAFKLGIHADSTLRAAG